MEFGVALSLQEPPDVKLTGETQPALHTVVVDPQMDALQANFNKRYPELVIEAMMPPTIANVICGYLLDEHIFVQVAGFEWCPHSLHVPPLRFFVDPLTTVGEVLRRIKLVEQQALLHAFEYINTVDGRTLARYNPDTPSNVILVMNDDQKNTNTLLIRRQEAAPSTVLKAATSQEQALRNQCISEMAHERAAALFVDEYGIVLPNQRLVSNVAVNRDNAHNWRKGAKPQGGSYAKGDSRNKSPQTRSHLHKYFRNLMFNDSEYNSEKKVGSEGNQRVAKRLLDEFLGHHIYGQLVKNDPDYWDPKSTGVLPDGVDPMTPKNMIHEIMAKQRENTQQKNRKRDQQDKGSTTGPPVAAKGGNNFNVGKNLDCQCQWRWCCNWYYTLRQHLWPKEQHKTAAERD